MPIPNGAGEQGFSLVEGMLALLVLAFGLLMVAGMQEVALSRNMDANQLSIATNLASDMVERIRFNRLNVAAYAGIDTSRAVTKPPSTQPMAQGDYDQWSARLAASGLKSAKGLVTVTAIGPQGSTGLNQNQVAVQVVWTGTMFTHQVTLATVVAPE
ncbi:type IV pilus modification PilV family protein [Nitrospira sp. Kam-Ns4a]